MIVTLTTYMLVILISAGGGYMIRKMIEPNAARRELLKFFYNPNK